MIAVTTPTGQIGHQVLERILDVGEPVRVVARDPSRLGPAVRERVEVVEGSHDDLDVLTEAFAGADRVFWLVPPNPRAENVLEYYRDFTRPACEAIERQGVDRVVGVTSLGRGFSRPAGLLSAAFAMDELIERTGVSYRALGMPFFMENLLSQVGPIKTQGRFFMANAADRPLATVATRDIAAQAAELLLDDSWSGQEGVPVAGPDQLSPNDMAQVMSEVLEQPIRFQYLPPEGYKATLTQHGMSDGFAQGIIDMVAAQNQGIYDAGERTPPPAGHTSFRQWCEQALKPAVLA